MLLPAFGGSSLVWNTSMVVFQALLLLGYLYAHFSTRWLGAKRQAWLHIALHVVALAWLPLTLDLVESTDAPWVRVVLTLAAGLGIPFFVISSNAPTLQRWYTATDAPDRDNPYRLYAASNVGSLTALLGYPLLVEPWLGIRQQAVVWSVAFIALILGLTASATQLRAENADTPQDVTPTPGWGTRLTWTFLSAVPSSLLLGCTTFLTSDIAALPLLWVLPLAAYLATFIFAFAGRRILSTVFVHRAAVVCMLVVAGQLAAAAYMRVWLAIPIHLVTLFFVSLAFHQSLVDRRPAADHLTDFYIWMSVGGVIGGAFTALLAPVIFDRPFEYPLMFAIALFVSGTQIPRLAFSTRALAGILVLIFGVEGVLFALGAFSTAGPTYAAAIAAMGALPLLMWFRQPKIACHAVAIAMVVVTWRPFEPDLLERIRSPYGIYRIARGPSKLGPQNVLLHGRINHGMQTQVEGLRRLPSTYYSLRSPIGQTFEILRQTHDTRPVGVVGLGVGTLATYAQPGQEFDFFEIDPVIAEQARMPSRFTYLADSAGSVNVLIGDGRKLIESQPDGKYRLLVLDAYSSDSIPVHLLTVEALDVYMSHTTEDGWLLFHVTNGFINVRQIVANGAATHGWAAIEQTHWPRESQDIELGATTSEWVAVARNRNALAPLLASGAWKDATADGRPVWTDDYANILPYWQ